MRTLLVRWVINAAALYVADVLVSGMRLSGGVLGVLAVAAVFGIINALIKPVVTFFSLPFIILSLGLLTFVINAAMLWLTSKFTVHL